MSGFLGMTPEDVEGLAAEFALRADELDATLQAIGARLDATSWRGADRDAFESDWRGELVAAIAALATALREAGVLASANASQQRQVSG